MEVIRNKYKKPEMINITKVKDVIGAQGYEMVYDRIDFFTDRFNKGLDWAIITYTETEKGKEIVKQFITFIYNAKDRLELLNNTKAKEHIFHTIDHAALYFREGDKNTEKNMTNMVFVEYSDNKVTRKSMKVLKIWKDIIKYIYDEYRINDSRTNTRFDGYYRDPEDIPTKESRRELRYKKEANQMPMPEPKRPSIQMRVVGSVASLIDTIKNYKVEKNSIKGNIIDNKQQKR